MGRRSGLFGIVVGVALLLCGLGFAILVIGGALRNPENALNSILHTRTPKAAGPTPSPRRKEPIHHGESPTGGSPALPKQTHLRVYPRRSPRPFSTKQEVVGSVRSPSERLSRGKEDSPRT
jgi:hypothetical protein